MKLDIDTEKGTIGLPGEGKSVALYSREGFELLSRLWLKVGWDQKYTYTFSWLGRPIIQLPDDMFRLQEVIHAVAPDVIVETGVAHGGSLVFYATLCKALGKGRVVGVDIEVRPHNKKAIEEHPLSSFITLVEGDSKGPSTMARIQGLIKPGEKVLVILDSDHSYRHVMGELEAYAPLVTRGSYLIATDGVMRDVADTPRGKPHWDRDNPAHAAEDFAAKHPEFVLESPRWPFNESGLSSNVTHWPSAWLRRT